MSERPKKRSECEDGPRPCPWVSCKYNLAIDVKSDGALIEFPHMLEPEFGSNCCLDHAAEGGLKLADIGRLYGHSRELIRQKVTRASARLKMTRELAEYAYKGKYYEFGDRFLDFSVWDKTVEYGGCWLFMSNRPHCRITRFGKAVPIWKHAWCQSGREETSRGYVVRCPRRMFCFKPSHMQIWKSGDWRAHRGKKLKNETAEFVR